MPLSATARIAARAAKRASQVGPVTARDADDASALEIFPSITGGETRSDAPRSTTRPVRVLTYGTFDLFHIGHLRLLQRLRALGDHLTVAVSTDEFNALKGKRSIVPYCDRAAIVAACRYVDAVIPENGWDQKREDIAKYGIDVFGMGDDWAGRFDELGEQCKVVYLPRTSGISSTAIKDQMKVLDEGSIASLRSAIEVAQQVLSRLA